MADKAVSELIEAERITATDLFVLEQNGTAKKLTGQVLLNWLTAAADGHGGIQSIQKVSTNGLADTYRIILADTTTFDFVVTNGRGVSGITKTATSGLVDTYTISYNDGTSGTFTVTNGAKGDKGDNQYVWIKYASQKPTASSHSFGDVADNWIGIYSGDSATAPTNWQQYTWFEIKGAKGDQGNPATLTSSKVEYQVSDSGTIIPSGAWAESVPVVPQGKYLWTRTTNTFNTGSPVVAYSVSRMGLDGTGSVSSVANVSPDPDGNVPLTAEHVGAVPSGGGAMTGELKMNGQSISGLNAPTATDQAVNMGYVNQQVKKAAPRNLLDNSDFRIAQAGYCGHHGGELYVADRWTTEATELNVSKSANHIDISVVSGTPVIMQKCTDEMAEYLMGKTVTIALKDGSGNIRIASGVVTSTEMCVVVYGDDFTFGISLFPASKQLMRLITNSGCTASIQWVAVYEGEYTAETLPEYQPKGYGAELYECMRYFQKNETDQALYELFGDWKNTVAFMMPMRIVPTVTLYSDNADLGIVECTTHGFQWMNNGKTQEFISGFEASADL